MALISKRRNYARLRPDGLGIVDRDVYVSAGMGHAQFWRVINRLYDFVYVREREDARYYRALVKYHSCS